MSFFLITCATYVCNYNQTEPKTHFAIELYSQQLLFLLTTQKSKSFTLLKKQSLYHDSLDEIAHFLTNISAYKTGRELPPKILQLPTDSNDDEGFWGEYLVVVVNKSEFRAAVLLLVVNGHLSQRFFFHYKYIYLYFYSAYHNQLTTLPHSISSVLSFASSLLLTRYRVDYSFFRFVKSPFVCKI